MSEHLTETNLSAQYLDLILQTITEGLFIIDKEGEILYSNKALQKMTGLSEKELKGKKCCSIMSEHCNPPPDCSLYSKGSINNVECMIHHKSGTSVPVLKNAVVLKTADGKVLGAVETLSDLTRLKSAELRLRNLQESTLKRSGLTNLIGKNHQMQETYKLIELAAASNTTILITGESGTGKELVADAIHSLSSRKNSPLIKVNCSALPESLLESELFGHVRGAFTGAVREKAGRFELAEGGTVFLDEIGELSPLIQIKLLRFLQDKSFERLGEGTTRKADVRIISSTHRDLRKLVQEGSFREDLFYRLKVFPIHLPPLRERKEDISSLSTHFIRKFNKESGKKISGITNEATLAMMDYCWPGNVRELEHAIEHAFVTCTDEQIVIFDLPIELRKMELRNSICNKSSSVANLTFPPSRHDIAPEQIWEVLKECNGNRSEAARRLGMDRTTLWRKLKKDGRNF